MEKLILILGILFSFTTLKAQEITLKKGETVKEFKKGTYYKTPNDLLGKFEGVWEYKNGNEFFKIEIKRQKTFVKGFDIYIDNLNGKYCYSRVPDCSLNENIVSMTDEGNNTNKLNTGYAVFMFHDIEYDKLGKVEFHILENGTAKWTLKNREMIVNSTKSIGFSVPTDIILTKVN
jgi:uncharacterized protein (DUF2249 family)